MRRYKSLTDSLLEDALPRERPERRTARSRHVGSVLTFRETVALLGLGRDREHLTTSWK
jgi:hypothetical protein